MRKVEDLLGNEIRLGDKVAWPRMTSTKNGTVEYGEVIGIKYCPVIIKVTCRIIKSGTKWNKGNVTFHVPSYYHKFIKVSS